MISSTVLLLLFTGKFRADDCKNKCRPVDLVSNDRKKFMDTTNNAILETLLHLQTTHTSKLIFPCTFII